MIDVGLVKNGLCFEVFLFSVVWNLVVVFGFKPLIYHLGFLMRTSELLLCSAEKLRYRDNPRRVLLCPRTLLCQRVLLKHNFGRSHLKFPSLSDGLLVLLERLGINDAVSDLLSHTWLQVLAQEVEGGVLSAKLFKQGPHRVLVNCMDVAQRFGLWVVHSLELEGHQSFHKVSLVISRHNELAFSPDLFEDLLVV